MPAESRRDARVIHRKPESMYPEPLWPLIEELRTEYFQLLPTAMGTNPAMESLLESGVGAGEGPEVDSQPKIRNSAAAQAIIGRGNGIISLI